MAEHTPGPWEMLESWPGSIRIRAFVVASVSASGLAIADVTSSVADARLMAAAPEMRDAGKTLASYVYSILNPGEWPEGIKSAMRVFEDVP